MQKKEKVKLFENKVPVLWLNDLYHHIYQDGNFFYILVYYWEKSLLDLIRQSSKVYETLDYDARDDEGKGVSSGGFMMTNQKVPLWGRSLDLM